MPTPDDPINSVLRNQEYFRLKKVVQSPGDIYEIDQSTRAIYIGPDSDIAEARITYYNPSEPLGLETADISVNGPFVGRMDALMATRVPSTGQLARILVSPVDIVNNAYTPPPGMVQTVLRQYNIEAKIDLICALKTLPSIPAVRADKTFRFPNVPYYQGANPNATEIILPIYGRRMITAQFVNASIGFACTFSLVALQPGSDPGPLQLGTLTVAGASVSQTSVVVLKASDAKWSVAGLDGVNAVTLDTQGLSGAKGVADLLVLHIAPTGGALALTRYVDVFVKLSDRES